MSTSRQAYTSDDTTTRVIWQKAKSPWQVDPTRRLYWQYKTDGFRLYSPGGSTRLTVWLQFAIACVGWGSTPKSPLFRDPHLTQCVVIDPTSVPAKWHLNQSNGLSRRHKCDIQTTDRQTDHATEECVAIGGIACTARAIAPKSCIVLLLAIQLYVS